MKTGAPLGEVQRLKTCVCVCANANCKLKNIAFVSSFALNSNPQFNLNYLFPATQVARWIKNPLQYRKHRKTSGRSLGWKDPLEEGMSNPYSILTWKIRGTWRATIHTDAKSQTQLKQLSTHTLIPYFLHSFSTHQGSCSQTWLRLWASEDSTGLDFWDATAHGGRGDRELSRDVP